MRVRCRASRRCMRHCSLAPARPTLEHIAASTRTMLKMRFTRLLLLLAAARAGGENAARAERLTCPEKSSARARLGGPCNPSLRARLAREACRARPRRLSRREHPAQADERGGPPPGHGACVEKALQSRRRR